MEWIKENWLEILAVTGNLYAIAQVVARLTPTKKDDEIISWLGKVLNLIFSKSRTK